MKALSGQSLLDLAVQSSGSVSAAFALAVKNGVSITDEPSGDIRPTDTVAAPAVQQYYDAKAIKPGTYSTPATPSLTGIGNMIIEQNFIVD